MSRWPLLLATLWGACSSRTPESVCAALVRGVAEGDAVQVFAQLDEPTRWAMYTVEKNHRRMRELIAAAYAPGEKEAALSRLHAGTTGSGEALFAEIYAGRYAALFAKRLGTGSLVVQRHSETEARCARQSGQGLRLSSSAQGRWGVAELSSEWKDAELRAVHDLATVEKNAELYRSALQAPK